MSSLLSLPRTSSQLHEKIVLITGAGGGIGSAVARTVIAQGGKALIHDINTHALAALAAADQTGLGEVAQPQDVANVIAFLASGLARHATGTTIDVNGASYVR